MNRDFEFMQALKWPFQSENWLPGIVIPGGFIFGYYIVYFIGYFGMMAAFIPILLAASMDPSGFSTGVGMIFYMGLMMAVMFLISCILAPVFGYYWEVVRVLREDGYEAAAPVWTGNVKEYAVNGIKALGFLFIVSTVSLILYSLLFFPIALILPENSPSVIIISNLSTLVFLAAYLCATPFVLAAFMHTAEEKTFRGLFNLGKAFEIGREHFGKVMMGVLYAIGVCIGYIPVLLIASCTVAGAPFAMAAYGLTLVHLFTQAFDDYREGPDVLAQAAAQSHPAGVSPPQGLPQLQRPPQHLPQTGKPPQAPPDSPPDNPPEQPPSPGL